MTMRQNGILITNCRRWDCKGDK